MKIGNNNKPEVDAPGFFLYYVGTIDDYSTDSSFEDSLNGIEPVSPLYFVEFMRLRKMQPFHAHEYSFFGFQ